MATEPGYYTTSEIAKLTLLVGRAAVTAARGGNPAKHDAAIDRIQNAAVEREAAEQAAREKVAAEKAAEKAKRKAERWF